jgi:hypothetical protein
MKEFIGPMYKTVEKESPKIGDITPTHPDFEYFASDFNREIRNLKRLKNWNTHLTHMRVMAEQSETVRVTSYNPDGEETTRVIAFYSDQFEPEKFMGVKNPYAWQYRMSTVVYFKYSFSLLAGGEYVNGQPVSVRELAWLPEYAHD